MAKENPKKEITERKTKVARHLKCPLTEEELRTAADALAQNLDDKDALEAELTAVKASFKAKIEQCEANTRVNQRLVRDKYEFRSIRCEMTFYFKTNIATTVREDTEEIIEERALTQDEKQMKIDFDKEAS